MCSDINIIIHNLISMSVAYERNKQTNMLQNENIIGLKLASSYENTFGEKIADGDIHMEL